MRSLYLAFVLPAISTSFALTLSQFQPIVSFPSACTAAYNSQIPSCTTNDFTNGRACSQACIQALTTISQQLNAACTGSRADPQTLIGLFFEGTGVETLCPNAAGISPVQSSNGVGQSTLTESNPASLPTSIVVATSYATSSTASPAPASTTTTSTSSIPTSSTTSTTSTPSSTVSQASSLSSSVASAAQTSSESVPSILASITSTTSTTANSQKSSKIDNNEGTSLRGGFSTTAVNDGQATVLTSQAQRTDSSNPDAFGGGGSPFEVGDNSGAAICLNLARVLAMAVGTALYIVFANR